MSGLPESRIQKHVLSANVETGIKNPIMQKTIHVKNIEKYHPGYKDRHLIWCKTYFSMLDSDNEFEMLEEIDKWRFVSFTILELKLKKPIPCDEKYLTRKGFDFKKKSLEKTLNSLSPFIDVCNNSVTENDDLCNSSVTQNRIEYNRIDKNRIEENIIETPDWIPKNEWNQFLEMRKKIKKPPTEHAKELLIKDLENLKGKGQNPIDVLNQSIKFNWQGLFEIKREDNNGTAKAFKPRQPTPEEQAEMDRYAALSTEEQKKEDDRSLITYAIEQAKKERGWRD